MSSGYGYMAKIGADTSGLQAALKGVDSSLRAVDREINATNRSIKAANQAGVNSTQMYKQKETELAAAIEKTKEKLIGLNSVEEQMKTARQNNRITAEQYREYQREISNTEAQLRRYETELRNVQQEERRHNQMSEEFRGKLLDISNAAQRVGSDLMWFLKVIGGTAAAMGTAAAAAGKYSVGVGSAFEGAMSSVKAYSGASEDEFKMLSEAAKEAGATTSKSAKESADALGYMALAGWDTKEMLEGLNPILRASEAGNADLARTSDLVTDSMSAMGIKTEDLAHYLDVCSAAQSNSNTTLTALLEAYIGCGGTMRNLNISIEESATWLGVLANRGIKASEAGTAFNSILVNLIGANKSADTALKQLGVSAWDSEGNFIGLTKTLTLLNDALSDCTEQEKSFFEAKIGGKTQMDTLQALLSGLNDEYGELYNVLSDCDGALGDTAQTMQDNLTGAITIMKSALEGVGVEIYGYLEEPLRETVEAVTELLDGINNSIKNGELSETLEKIGDKLGKLLKKIAELVADNGVSLLVDGIDALISALDYFVERSHTVISVVRVIGVGFAVWKIGSLVADVVHLTKAISGATVAMEAMGGAAAVVGASLAAVLPIAAAIAGSGALMSAALLEVVKASNSVIDISQKYVNTADDVIAANNDLIDSINEAREASEKAEKETEEQIKKADEAKKKIDGLCDSNGNLKDASLDVNDELKILNDTFGTQLTVIDGQIQGWRDLKISYEDYCTSLRANAQIEARHQSYVDALAELPKAQARFEQAQEDYANAYLALKNFKGGSKEELENLTAELKQADTTLKQARADLDLTQKVVDDDEKFFEENSPEALTRKRQGQYGGMQEEAAANANPGNTKYSDTMDRLKEESDAELKAQVESLDERLKNKEISLREYTEEYGKLLDNAGFKDTETYAEYSKVHAQKESELSDNELQEFADNLDYKVKTHQMTQEQADAELQKYLNTHVNKSSELWWKYTDSLNKGEKTAADKKNTELDTQADDDLKAEKARLDHLLKTHQINQEQYDTEMLKYLNEHTDKDSELWNQTYDEITARETERAEKKKSEDEKRSDEDLKSKKEALDKQLENGEITLDEYVAGMRKILDEAAVKETDQWKSYAEETADKAAESIKKKQEAIKTAVTDINKAMKEAAEKIENIRKSAADNISSGSLFDNVETTKGTRPVFHDLSKRAAEIRQYAANYKKLSEMDNIPPDLLAEIKSMSFDDRRAVVSELLKMTESNRQRYFMDYSSYKAAAREAAKIETSGEVSEIVDNLGDTITDTLAGVNIFDIGAAMGSQWMQGFKSSMSPVNAADVVSISSSGYSGAAQQHNKSQSSTPMIPITTPININIGTETITTTVEDVLTSNGLMGRGNSRL